MPPPTYEPFAPAPSAPSSSSTPKRRPRVDSDIDSTTSRPVLDPHPKRPRSEHYSPSSLSAASAVTMSAKVQGKRPEVIDLTGNNPGSLVGSSSSQPRVGLQPQLGSRKLVVKNLRPVSQTPAGTGAGAGSSSALPKGAGTGASPVETYYTRVHAELDAGLASIFAGRTTNQPMERLYRGVEDICRKGDAAELTAHLRSQCEAWLTGPEMLGGLGGLGEAAIPTISSGPAGGEGDGDGYAVGDHLLRQVVARWRRWNDVIFVLRGVFSYLDRGYLLMQVVDGGRGRQGINEIAIMIFRRVLFGPGKAMSIPSLGKTVLEAVCRLVDYARHKDERADGVLLRDAMSMMRLSGVYSKAFEPMFLVRSHRYYEQFASDMSAASGLKDYIVAVTSLLERETARCDGFNFESTTKRQLLGDANHVLIESYSEKLLDSGSVARLLEAHDVESMKALYELLKLTNLQKRLKGPWESYIRDTGSKIVSDTERGDDMVVRLLELRRALDVMIRDAFDKDDVFYYSLRESFGHFINKRQNTSAWNTGTSKVGEMIAKYIDLLLRGGLKTLPKSLLSDIKDKADAEMSGVASTGDEDAELDRQLDHGLELFRFIEGKDVFEAFYKRDLARRLLMGRSASQDAERSMLAKLKVECGSSFTHNLEQMFKDQELAREEMASYKEWMNDTGRTADGVDLTVNILSAAAWPTFPDVKVLLPKEVLTQINVFDAYYKNKHTGRRLTWKHNMAHCALRAQFNRGVKELLVSAPQAAVLILFNDVEEKAPEAGSSSSSSKTAGILSYDQISQSTGLTGGELDRTLQSLACGRARVLSKHPKGRDVAPTDTFSVNKAFTDPKFRVKINQIQMRETREENRETHERVAADRQFETQAAIVRVMKSRKTMTHVQLVDEVINQTKSRGAVDVGDIKANIEKLIEKDYIEREGGSYVYLA
ncbi:Cullin family-domain-containing protein [Chaetomium sp. MPI-SDFR-AT-0129]|nr:Cullin family-domain-containing protein [Chaetomium sp. MPI-SDFR-AT-0129]